MATRPSDAAPVDPSAGQDFALFYDAALTEPTPYSLANGYVAKARDRMDRTFRQIAPFVAGATVLDIGASPFYLLDRAKRAGAARCHGVYFANDDHPLRGLDQIHSAAGPIEISHADAENERFPFADDGVDVLTACEILEHFDSFPVNFSKEVRRVLRPGGHLCLTVPNVASIGNIIKLIFQKNIYMKYRSDVTGRHKHEYTLAQLRAYIGYLGMDVVRAGFMPSPTSDLYALRPAYQAIAHVPVMRNYSPVLYVLARQPDVKPTSDLAALPPALYDDVRSIEE